MEFKIKPKKAEIAWFYLTEILRCKFIKERGKKWLKQFLHEKMFLQKINGTCLQFINLMNNGKNKLKKFLSLQNRFCSSKENLQNHLIPF